MYAEFLHDPVSVARRRFEPDAEAFGRCLGRAAFGNAPQDIPFPRCQTRKNLLTLQGIDGDVSRRGLRQEAVQTPAFLFEESVGSTVLLTQAIQSLPEGNDI